MEILSRLGIKQKQEEEPEIPSQFLPQAELGSSRDEYLRVASAVGLAESPALRFECLRQFIQSENIRCFNSDQVHTFLDKKMGKGKWEWAPLRQSDLEHRKGWRDGDEVPFGTKIYTEAVPLPVLLTMEKIQAALPDAHFYVSHNSDPNEDPFLYVTVGVNGYIVERWDEPDFRER